MIFEEDHHVYISKSKSSHVGYFGTKKKSKKVTPSFTPKPSRTIFECPSSAQITFTPPKRHQDQEEVLNAIDSDKSSEGEEEYNGLKAQSIDCKTLPKSPKKSTAINLLEENYHDIIKSIKLDTDIRKMSVMNADALNKHKTTLANRLWDNCIMTHQFFPKKSISTLTILPNEEEMANLSNIEEITNFYEYTENCFRMILDIEQETNLTKCKPIKFPFIDKIGEKRLAVFDLDETLVHCQVKNIKNPQSIIEVTLPSKQKGKIGVNVRPNWEKALDLIKDHYIIVIYSASHQSYADAVLDYMDPGKKYFPYRLYRNNCSIVKMDGKEIYIKDLNIFQGIDLKDVLMIDNSVLSFAFHLDNGIPIVPYYDSETDVELVFLAYYLNSILSYDDLRKANQQFVKMDYYRTQAVKALQKESEEETEWEDAYSDKEETPFSGARIKQNRTKSTCVDFSAELKETLQDLKKQFTMSN